VVFIEKGTYRSVSLDGMAIAQVGQSPDGETMIQSFGNWDFVNLYIDEKANPEQRKALEEIGKTVSPLGAPPERTQIKYVPITRRVEGSEHIIAIGSLGSFSGHLISGGMGGNPKIVPVPTPSIANTNRAGPPGRPSTTPDRSGTGRTPTTCLRPSRPTATSTKSTSPP
jgi:hypothetical protein